MTECQYIDTAVSLKIDIFKEKLEWHVGLWTWLSHLSYKNYQKVKKIDLGHKELMINDSLIND